MFLGSYTFGGDLHELTAAYDRLLASLPPDMISLHVCVTGPDALQVFDACPSRDDWRAFASSPEFHGAIAAAGLPEPVVIELGEVHTALLNQPVRA